MVSRSSSRRAGRREARQRDDQQELAQLGGLEVEEAELDRPPRPARGEAEHVDEQDRADHEAVDAELPFAQARVVEARDSSISTSPAAM